jgi:hypothetical protein
VLFIAVGVAPGLALAHPTLEELAERAQLRTLCSRAADPGERFDPIGLAGEESALRSAWGDALRTQKIERVAADFQHPAPAPSTPTGAGGAGAVPDAEPFAEQLRLLRMLPDGDIRAVEYELFRQRVYRIRWTLSERFHVPIMDAIVHQAGHCYGEPEYDQTIEAKIASGEATFRRAGWRREGRLLEIRQLNPLLGGPVLVTVTDVAASRAIIAAEGSLAPEPDRRSQPWWQRAGGTPRLPSDEEREALVRAFAGILSQTDF